MDKKYIGRPNFKIFKPKTLGSPPTPRYMHTMNFIPRLNQVVLYGGRNDFLPNSQVLGDLFLLKLHNLEWVKVSVGGDNLPIERCNHCSLVNGTELIIFGGMNKSFQLTKDMIIFELAQDKVKRTSPYVTTLAAGMMDKLKGAEVKRITKTNI
jgi:hypothetical protein